VSGESLLSSKKEEGERVKLLREFLVWEGCFAGMLAVVALLAELLPVRGFSFLAVLLAIIGAGYWGLYRLEDRGWFRPTLPSKYMRFVWLSWGVVFCIVLAVTVLSHLGNETAESLEQTVDLLAYFSAAVLFFFSKKISR